MDNIPSEQTSTTNENAFTICIEYVDCVTALITTSITQIVGLHSTTLARHQDGISAGQWTIDYMSKVNTTLSNMSDYFAKGRLFKYHFIS
jgi:hypothetical protein